MPRNFCYYKISKKSLRCIGKNKCMISRPGFESLLSDLSVGKFSHYSEVCRHLWVTSDHTNNHCMSLSWGLYLWKHSPGQVFKNILTQKGLCSKNFYSQRSHQNKQRKIILTELNLWTSTKGGGEFNVWIPPPPTPTPHPIPLPATPQLENYFFRVNASWTNEIMITPQGISVLVSFSSVSPFVVLNISAMHHTFPGFWKKISVTLTSGALERPRLFVGLHGD